MSAFGNDVKDEVYNAIKELFANGYKISDLLEIVRYAVESKECEEGDWINGNLQKSVYTLYKILLFP